MQVITSCDGIKKIYKSPVTLKKIFKDVYPKHLSRFIAGFIDNKLVDLNTLVYHDSSIIMIDENNKNFLQMIRRSCMQLLNRVLKDIWPHVKIASGCITESGFYCDIDMPYILTKKDLNSISKQMLKNISNSYEIYTKTILKKDFLELLKKKNEIYQISIVNKQSVNENNINICYHEDYYEFCIQPQVSNIKFCKYFLLKDISGAYWKNNKENKMLQRIHVIVQISKKRLTDFILKIKELEKRDHRKISNLLNLYHIQKESPGMIFWHENGYIIFKTLEDFIRKKLIKNNYIEVKSPIILDKSLWKKSGHWTYYNSSIFVTESENRKYCIKPMNCPAHVQIFKHGLKSYKDLPIRMAEFGSCHRQESSGSLHGLMRVRGFTQDDAHIFCTKKQIKLELNNCINLLFDLYSTFGFKKITIKFSTRPEKRIGDDKIWDQAERDLESVLKEHRLIFEYKVGEGAFYGPKIEIALEDSLQRIWQCGTIQLDFYLSKKLNAYYINKDNIKKYPIIIHRAFLGSIERFIGILIEEYNGNLPIWLCPIQVVIISISKSHVYYVEKIVKLFLSYNIRVISDITENSISFKIRNYINKKIPYILICGDKEIKNNNITVRNRFSNKPYQQNIDSFIKNIINNITNYSIKDFNMED
ncbi:Threonine--tRNA ligase [Buchnera aphidicola (Cinara piceae)]|uniref:Threonine--tRNA ligase n=1 Tax=Buchnera aphidicola (Cinara piceae) TaxID=1660043 RepID=A0A803FTF3_9GAMM|nr:threonine--tRNA ligase [Buchnera aphidicola]VFP87972.1 Threonine--tRNA ligase [Buchnera aphidicola (Cinara piceae)]